ncbi:hypothetical protein DVH24_003768 [Malus domestica]|uniref:Uncharacterized protein n=1 Tax=Malus domestica TaxID=3750 RepID=A0A498K6U8_MALDO|nr:hypothetical protein DVH24_003768 [Malus domestica]
MDGWDEKKEEEEEEEIGQNCPTRGRESRSSGRERVLANGKKRERRPANRNRERRKGERARSGGEKEEKWVFTRDPFRPATPTPKFRRFSPEFSQIGSSNKGVKYI